MARAAEFRRRKEIFQMTVRVAINGFGRIGRNILLYHRDHQDLVVAINDLGGRDHICCDMIQCWPLPHEVKVAGAIDVGRGPIQVTAIKSVTSRDPKIDIF
jgi:glyceraldehyde 3-phosphate dehydrogenase